MSNEKFLLKGGKIVDPASGSVKVADLRIADGKIAMISPRIDPLPGESVIDVSGKIVMPGLVDTHVHIRPPYSHYMLARAGVTTALDLDTTGEPEGFLRFSVEKGCGLHVGFLRGIVPTVTVPGPDPSDEEISRVIDYGIDNGALGVKIIGGHRPLTRRATRRAVHLAHDRKAWIAFHTGTCETNGDICGLLEAVELSDGLPLHIAHINSYCRGGVYGALNEAKLAIDALSLAPNCHCESYIATQNGTSGIFTDENTPRSRVTGNELRRCGYPVTKSGLRQAIADGVVRVMIDDDERRERIYGTPEEGLALFDSNPAVLPISFPANRPLSSIPLAIAKKDNGDFVIASLSTDGGSIPRNLTLHQGLLLVKFGAFTLPEFALKACLNPAKMLGFSDRGYLQEGAAADVIAVDYDKMVAELVFSDGKLICDHGEITGSGSTFLIHPRGEAALKRLGFNYKVCTPDWLETTAPAVNPGKPKRTIGILGGLGPAATADLFRKLVAATPAKRDQEHPHTVIDNDSLIPDRTAALEGRGESPVPEMIAAARRLEAAGAEFIIMPCNTAHAFLPQVEKFVNIPFLNMITAVANRIKETMPEAKKIGLLATSGTVKTGLYRDALAAVGLEIVIPDEAGQKRVMDAIYSPEYGVKAGHCELSGQMLKAEGEALAKRGAAAVILGCTEIPLAVHPGDLSVPVIDTTQVLAEEAVKRSMK